MRRRTVVAMAGLLVILAAGTLAVFMKLAKFREPTTATARHTGEAAEDSNSEAGQSRAVVSASGTPVSSATQTSPAAPPLPNPSARLVDIYQALDERAKSGDLRAACRLASDMYRCRFLPQLSAVLDTEITRAAGAQAGSDLEASASSRIDDLRQRMASSEQICAGMDARISMKAWEYLLRAANQGHVDSMLHFAIQPPLDEAAFLNDQEGWAAYRDHAVPLLERAAASGSTLALYQLYRMHLGGAMPGGIETQHRDPARAFAYGEILARYSSAQDRPALEARLSRMASELTASQIHEARLAVARIAGKDFVPITDRNAQLASARFDEHSDACGSADLTHASR